jgi:hypothetical protein
LCISAVVLVLLVGIYIVASNVGMHRLCFLILANRYWMRASRW